MQLCTEAIRTVQMSSESLLLRDRDQPLSKQPFSGCCDTLVARRKQLNIAATNAVACLKGGRSADLCKVSRCVFFFVSLCCCLLGELT